MILHALEVFYDSHKIICLYYLAVNVLTFIFFAADKAKARRRAYRIKESVLLGLSFIGGAAGALLAMLVCRHKVRKARFKFEVPLMLCAHLALMTFLL